MSRLTAGERAAFLKALTLGHTVTKAAELIGRGRRTMYDARGADEQFAKEWDAAIEVGVDLFEEEARRRAFEGVERKVYYQGEEIAVERTYSDTLLVQLLRVRAPQRWGNKLKIDASIEVDIAERIIAARKRAGWPWHGGATDAALPDTEPTQSPETDSDDAVDPFS